MWSASSLESVVVRQQHDQEEGKERGRQRTATLKNLGDLIRPVLGEHLIGLVDDRVLDATHGEEIRLIHESAQTTGCGDEDVATLAEVVDLLTHRVSTVGNTRAEHALVAHASSLVKDLNSELAGRNDDDHERLSADAVLAGVVRVGVGVDLWARSAQLLGLAHQLAQDGNEVGCGLARA